VEKLANSPSFRVSKEAKKLSIFIFRPKDTYLSFSLPFFYERGPDRESQKLVELRTKIAPFSAFSFLPSRFPSLPLVQFSLDQQAPRAPIKL